MSLSASHDLVPFSFQLISCYILFIPLVLPILVPFHLFLLPGVLPHPSTQLKYPFLQEDFQPLRPRSKVSSSHLHAELTPLSAHSWRPDFYCVLLHSFFKELLFQCGKHCDSVIYNHTRTSCEGSIEVEATSSSSEWRCRRKRHKEGSIWERESSFGGQYWNRILFLTGNSIPVFV